MTSTNLRDSVECCVLRIRRSADDLFVCSSCSIFCSITTIQWMNQPMNQWKFDLTYRLRQQWITFEFGSHFVGRLLNVGHQILELLLHLYTRRQSKDKVNHWLIDEWMNESINQSGRKARMKESWCKDNLLSSVCGAERMALCFFFTSSTLAWILSMFSRISFTWSTTNES